MNKKTHKQEVTCYSDNLVTMRGEGWEEINDQRKEVEVQTNGRRRGQAFEPDNWYKLHLCCKICVMYYNFPQMPGSSE